MADKNTAFELRIPAELLAKAEYVAGRENRTLNNHLLMLLRNNIAYYERIHEKIKLPPKENASKTE